MYLIIWDNIWLCFGIFKTRFGYVFGNFNFIDISYFNLA